MKHIKMTRLKSNIICMIMLMSMISASAYDFNHKAPSGHTLYFNVIQQDSVPYTAEVTSCPLSHCYEGNVIIPDTVTFEGKTFFVTSIAPHAFAKCNKLYAIELPNTLISIGNSGFRDCINLKSITFPESMTYIGSYSLVNCVSLQSIGIPQNITYIGNFAFGNCKSLYNIYVDIENTQYSSMAGILFDKEGKELIHYPATRDGESFDIPITVRFISDWAFCGAKFLKSIYIPNSVISIGRFAFWGCSMLTSIEIPNTVDVIKSRSFYDCRSLNIAYVSKSTKIVTTAFPPYTKISYTPKRLEAEEDKERVVPTPKQRIDLRPTALPMEIYALYTPKQDEIPVDLANNSELVAEHQEAEQNKNNAIAINIDDINIEEIIELQQMHGDDYANIVISNSPTGDDKDDVVKDDDIDVIWPVMDEDMEYYLSNYEKGTEEKVEYIDPKHKNRHRKRDSRIKRNYTMFGSEI